MSPDNIWDTIRNLPRDIQEKVLQVVNENEQSMAELHAYAECGFCHRLYSEMEWANLRPDASKPWANDGTHFEEHRFCAICDKSLSVRERFRERVVGKCLEYVTGTHGTCDHCHVPILPGDRCVIRVNEAGHRERGLWCGLRCAGEA